MQAPPTTTITLLARLWVMCIDCVLLGSGAGYMAYFRDRFPLLLPHVHRFIAGSVCAQEPLFSHYFAVPSSIT
eukprot:m.32503 g.32503  ORF g.32503 m.32503 type:complete len:73 (+) comp14132_c0_seq1:292-510(+)